MPSTDLSYVLLDSGVFIGALLSGDPRHQEALAIAAFHSQGPGDAFLPAQPWERTHPACWLHRLPPIYSEELRSIRSAKII
jgi:hypothetical protein